MDGIFCLSEVAGSSVYVALAQMDVLDLLAFLCVLCLFLLVS